MLLTCSGKKGRREAAIPLDALRFQNPLYTIAEAARIVDVPRSTFTSWAKGSKRRTNGQASSGGPVVTYVAPEKPRFPSIPFVGLAEAMVLTAVRRSGVPLQRIRPALEALERELGVQHALANQRLYTDGAEVLYDYSRRHPDTDGANVALRLVVIRNRQHVFTEIIKEYLRCLIYAPDGYVELMRLPAYRTAEVVVDPARSGGDPIFARGGCRVKDVMGRFWAGEPLKHLPEEFGVPEDHIEDALRVTSRQTASYLS